MQRGKRGKGRQKKRGPKNTSSNQLLTLLRNPSLRTETEPFVITAVYEFLQSAAGATATVNYVSANNPTQNFLGSIRTVVGSTVEGTRFQYGHVKAARLSLQAINGEIFGGFLFSSSIVQQSASTAPTNNNMTSYTTNPWGLQVNNSPDFKSHPVGPLTGKSSMEWVVTWEKPGNSSQNVFDTYSFITNYGPATGWTAPTTLFWFAFGFESATALTVAGVIWKLRIDYLVQFFGRNQMSN